MKSMKNKLRYILLALCGVYTAEVAYRIIRYADAAFSDEASFFGGIFGIIGEIIKDTDLFMIIEVCVVVVLTVLGIYLREFKKITVASLCINFLCGIVFLICVNSSIISWKAFLYTSAIVIPLYIISSLWCVFFSIRDMYRAWEKTNDSTT